jgi:HPt (histidine-containing phosphotransfer) domain-containing protein
LGSSNATTIALAELRERLDGDDALLRDMVQLFLEGLDERWAKLEEVVDGADMNAVHRQAHALKGSAANLGAHLLYEVMTELDSCAKAGETARLPETLARARAARDTTVAELRKLI